MTDSEPKTPAKRKPSAPKATSKATPKPAASKSSTPAGGPKAASKARGAASKAETSAASQPNAPTLPDAPPDEAPIPPRNRHERRSAGKKRPGQAPFKWPPIAPERP